MLQTLDKQGTSRAHANRLLALQTRAIQQAWLGNVAAITSPVIMRHALELLSAGKLNQAADFVMQRFASNIGNAYVAVFIDTASAECAALSPKLVLRKAPTISLSFNVADERAVRLMQQNRLGYIQGLTRQQQTSVRAALVRSTREGLGTNETAQLVRQALALDPKQQREVERYRQLITPTEQGRALDPEAEHLSPEQVSRMVNGKVEQGISARAERIARTESLRIVGQARDEALRQSLEATGQRAELSGKEWASTRDSRTRDGHIARDGQRRRLSEAFDGGIHRPGDGPAEESINCRCTLLYEFFDTEAELSEWLAGGA